MKKIYSYFSKDILISWWDLIIEYRERFVKRTWTTASQSQPRRHRHLGTLRHNNLRLANALRETLASVAHREEPNLASGQTVQRDHKQNNLLGKRWHNRMRRASARDHKRHLDPTLVRFSSHERAAREMPLFHLQQSRGHSPSAVRVQQHTGTVACQTGRLCARHASSRSSRPKRQNTHTAISAQNRVLVRHGQIAKNFRPSQDRRRSRQRV